MGRSLGYLTGVAAFALVIARLSRLIETGPGIDDWQVILIAAAVLGGVTWWLASQLVIKPQIALIMFSVAGVLLMLRVAVPGTLHGGFFPGGETFEALNEAMAETVQLVRHGLPPVPAIDGLVAVLSALVFVVGAIFAWGAGGGGPVSAIVAPSFVLYLQLSVFDQRQIGLSWMAAAAAVLAMSTASIALERRPDAGGARDGAGASLPRRSLPTAVATAAGVAVVALSVTVATASLVPENALVTGNAGVLEELFGGGQTQFDRWIDLNQQLLNPTGAIMFTASVDDPEAESLYWRVETLDTFDGAAWGPSDSSSTPYTAGAVISDLSESYAGTVVTVTQTVEIDRLGTQSGIAPTAGVPLAIQSSGSGLQPSEFGVLSDGSIARSGGLARGDSYQLVSQYADLERDLGSLSTGADGQLSPLFALAEEAGAWDESPAPSAEVSAPPNHDRYSALPEDLPLSLEGIAQNVTRGATTDFERGWLLQAWFRENGGFTYSADVSTGHSSLDLAAWLGDSNSLNYRTGYCEQFAASMAVLARTLGIESRVVWGFTPGTIEGGEIVVRDLNAHAWVELWIDGFGWVPFEPTPRSDGAIPGSVTAAFDAAEMAAGLEIPTTPTTQPPQGTPPVAGPDAKGAPAAVVVIVTLLTVAIALSLVPLIKLGRRSRRLKRLSEGEVAAAWDEIVDRLQDLGSRVSPSLTPLEVADRLDPRLVGVAARYSQEIYGERDGLGKPSDLQEAESFLKERFSMAKRTLGLLNPQSLSRRSRR